MNHGTGNYRLFSVDRFSFGRWYYLCVLLLALSGEVRAAATPYTYTPGGVSNTISAAGGSATITYNTSNNTFAVAYTVRVPAHTTEAGQPAQDYGVVFIDRVSGNGVNPLTSGTRLATYNGFNTSGLSGTYNGSYTPGEWLSLGVRTAHDNYNGGNEGGGYDWVVDTVVWTQAGQTTSQPTAVNKKILPWTFQNTKDYPVTYVIKDASGNFLHEQVVAANTTVSGTLDYDASLGPITHDAFVPATNTDGAWITSTGNPVTNGTAIPIPTPPQGTPYTAPSASPPVPSYNSSTPYTINQFVTFEGSTFVNISPSTGVAPPSSPSTSNANWVKTPPSTTATNITTPSSAPAAGVIQPGSQTVWSGVSATTDNERLDKKTYREGVDKQVAEAKLFRDSYLTIEEGKAADAEAAAAEKATREQSDADFLDGLSTKQNEWIAEADAAKASALSALNSSFASGPASVSAPGVPDSAKGQQISMKMAKVGSHAFKSFPSTIELNPYFSTYVPEWLSSGLGIIKAMLGFFWIAWLYTVTVRDARNVFMQIFMIQPTSSTALERAASEIPVGGAAVSLVLRAGWMFATIGVLSAVIPAIILIWEADVFSGYESFRDEVHAVLAQGGTWGKVISLFVATIPMATGVSIIVTRMVTESILTTIAVPVCAWFRLSKF